MCELKFYRGVICHDIEKWWKIGRGMNLSIWNWHQEFDEFWSEYSKASKIAPQWAVFDQSIKCLS